MVTFLAGPQFLYGGEKSPTIAIAIGGSDDNANHDSREYNLHVESSSWWAYRQSEHKYRPRVILCGVAILVRPRESSERRREKGRGTDECVGILYLRESRAAQSAYNGWL
ncbi:hypothetical protein QAD02_004001 [Eretmocerus hayati]|uniref:Uncharacterized protein n=1 Tax=Eretmocerus hayati TaxID=131215 RepID=A0ACC2NNM4_9HYME|nr:hypothetical protein QAD02_004001 [Eretmocerus hayati]